VSYQIPTLVFFDLGDVVCRFVPAERIKEFALRTGRTEQDLHELVWESGLSAECDQGKYTLDQMCRAINDAIGSELDDLTIIDAWRRAFVLNPDVYRIAREVSLKTRVGLLTNNAPVLRAAFPTWFAEVEALFDPILFTYELGTSKPDPVAFKQAQKNVNCAPSELMLIDDSRKNVEVARTLGWQTIHYVNPADLAETLKTLEVL